MCVCVCLSLSLFNDICAVSFLLVILRALLLHCSITVAVYVYVVYFDILIYAFELFCDNVNVRCLTPIIVFPISILTAAHKMH